MSKVLEVILKLVDQMTPGMEKAAQSVKKVGDGVDKTSQSFEKVKSVGQKAGEAINSGLDKANSGLERVKGKVQGLTDRLGEMGTALTSVFGALGLGSIMDMTFGLAMAREQMTTLMTATMGSASAAKEFVGYLDKMTDNSLVSLNELGSALNKIKMSTGMTNEELKKIAPTVNDIGQRALLMGMDATRTNELMVASYRGLNGEFEMLRSNFGITRELLLSMGWSGSADDVDGYTQALNRALERGGDMSAMMETTTGQIQLLKKAFSKAGREIGEVFMPVFKALLGGYLSLQKVFPNLAKYLIVIVAGFSAFALVLPYLVSIIGAFQKLIAVIKTANTVLFGLAVANKSATGAIVTNSVATNKNTAMNLINNNVLLAKSSILDVLKVKLLAAGKAMWAFMISPVGILIIAIAALVAILAIAAVKFGHFESGAKKAQRGLDGLKKSVEDNKAKIQTYGNRVDELEKKLATLDKGTTEYKLTLDELAVAKQNQKIATDNLAASERELAKATKKVEESYRKQDEALEEVNRGRLKAKYLSGEITKQEYEMYLQTGQWVDEIDGGTEKMDENSRSMETWGGEVGRLHRILGPFADTLGPFYEGFFNVGMMARNAWQNGIKPFLETLGHFTPLMAPAMSALTILSSFFNNVLWPALTGGTIAWDTFMQTVAGAHPLLQDIYTLITTDTSWFGIVMRSIFSLLGIDLQNSSKNTGKGIVKGFMDSIKGLPGKVKQELINIANQLQNYGPTLYEKAKGLGRNMYNGMIAGLGIKSPGYMYHAMNDELGRINNLLQEQSPVLNMATQNLGGDIASGFSNNARLAVSSQGVVKVQHQHEFHGLPAGVNEKEVARLVNQSLNDSRVRESLEVATYQTQRNILKPQGGL